MKNHIEPPNPLTNEEAANLKKSFSFWYHRIYLGNGMFTIDSPAYHEAVWDKLIKTLPKDLRGASVLDIGCNAGYFSIQLKLQNAGRVLGIEAWEDYFKQAEICKKIWGLDIEYRFLDAHQIGSIKERFDLVIFAGLLYHLKNPLAVLELAGGICDDAILVETEIIPEDSRNCIFVGQGRYGEIRVQECHKGFMKFIEADELNGDGSNWWVPDTECVMGMLRTAGFKHFSAPLYLTERRLVLAASKKSESIVKLGAINSQ